MGLADLMPCGSCGHARYEHRTVYVERPYERWSPCRVRGCDCTAYRGRTYVHGNQMPELTCEFVPADRDDD